MTPISISLNELKPALTGLGKMVPRDIHLHAHRMIHMERKADGHVWLSACGLKSQLRVLLDKTSPGEPLVLLAPFEDLQHLAKVCVRDEVLHFAARSKHQLIVSFSLANQTGEALLRSWPLDQYPKLLQVEGTAIPLNASVRASLHEAMSCASAGPDRITLQGAYLDTSNSESHYVVGTDGRHLYSSNSFHLPLEAPLIIPKHKFLGWRDFNADGEWYLTVGQKSAEQSEDLVQIQSRHWRFITPQVEGNYPQWKNVLPQADQMPTTFSFDPANLEEVMLSIELLPCHCEKFQKIGLEWRRGKLHLRAKETPESEWVRQPIDTKEGKGPDVTIYLDRRFLLKALRIGLTTVHLLEPHAPLRFSRGGKQMIVMPLRETPDVESVSTQPEPVVAPVESMPAPRQMTPQPQHTMKQSPPVHSPRQTLTSPPIETRLKEPSPSGEAAFEAALQQVTLLKDTLRNSLSAVHQVNLWLKELRLSQPVPTR